MRTSGKLYALLLIIVVIAVGAASILMGGMIKNIVFCANGKLLYIGPPRAGAFLFTPATRLYKWGILRPGAWVLGTASPGGACVCPYGDCKLPPLPAQGTIIMMGTSR